MGFFWLGAPVAMGTPEKYPIDRAALKLRGDTYRPTDIYA
jgi:hypothetical protein